MSSKDAEVQRQLQQLMADIESKSSLPDRQGHDQQPVASNQKLGWLERFKGNALLPLQILAIPWTQEIIDQVFFQGRWNLPVHPRTIDGISGIFTSAFSHANFAHLIGNTIAFTIFSWLILAKSRQDYWITFLIGWLGGGFATWLLGPQSAHGLSGVVYTLFGYLLFIGWLEKRIIPLFISVFVLINYSAFIWGVFPTHPMIAWWGHLFGFLLGILAAFGVYREPTGPRV